MTALPPANASLANSGRLPGRGKRLRAALASAAFIVAMLAGNRPATAWEPYPVEAKVSDDDDGSLELVLAIVGGIVATTPFWLPPAALHDDLSFSGSFLRYPYFDDHVGYVDPQGGVNAAYKPWAVNLETEYGYDLSAGASRFATHAQLDTWFRFGLDAEWSYLDGDWPQRAADHFQTGDVNVLYRFAQSERAQFHFGMGARWLSDAAGDDYGINFTYQAAMQPVRPATVKFHFDCGRLRSETFWHASLTAGLVYWHVETYAGFDYLKIDGAEFYGPAAGLRMYF